MYPFHHENIMRIEKVTLLIKNMRTALSFYQDILGLQLVHSDKTNAYLGSKHEVFIHLIEDQNAIEASITLGLCHFALLVKERKDLANFLVRLKQARYPITGASDHGVSEAIYLDDPDGNGIEIYWDHDVSEWPILDGHLTMFTNRLDLQSLLNEFDPTESNNEMHIKLGHLHLHVDDLKSSGAFFVNCLDFKIMYSYEQHALFIGDGGYHHHIGLNTWQKGAPLCGVRQVGLKAYDLSVPRSIYQELVSRIREFHIPIFTEKERNYILDPLNQKVFLNIK